MAAYSILFRESIRKDFNSMPAKDLQRIMERIALLAMDPRPSGSEKLSGQERYRIRQGNYRIAYSLQDDELTVWVVKVAHHREGYRS